MRNPARIDPILRLIGEAWKRSPDLRLGQIIVSAVRPVDPCPEVFSVEDDLLLRKIEALLPPDSPRDAIVGVAS
jgi:hypothetical protein